MWRMIPGALLLLLLVGCEQGSTPGLTTPEPALPGPTLTPVPSAPTLIPAANISSTPVLPTLVVSTPPPTTLPTSSTAVPVNSLIRTLEGHTDFVYSVAFSPDGQTLASASNDKTVKLWRVSDGSLIRTLQGTSSVESVVFSPDGQTLASGSADNTVRLWRVADGSLIRTLDSYTYGVQSVVFSPDGQTLASASDDKTVKLWRVK